MNQFNPNINYSNKELKELALSLKSEIKRVEELQGWLLEFYEIREYPILAANEYLDRLVKAQFEIGKRI